jgi:hypothetical protein
MISVSADQRRDSVISRNSLWRNSVVDKPALRVGVVLDSLQVARCYGAIIDDILYSNFANLELIVIPNCPSGNGHLGNGAHRHSLYGFYRSIESRKILPNHPLEKVDYAPKLANCERIELSVHNGPGAAATSKVKSQNLDVLIHFGSKASVSDIPEMARCGVWFYNFGDQGFCADGPACFWELYEGLPVSPVTLQAQTAGSNVVLCESFFATQQTISVSANRFAPFWGSTELVIRKLNELHQYGWDYLVQNSISRGSNQGEPKSISIPNDLEMVGWLGPVLLKKAVRYPFRQKAVQHWQLGVRANAKPLSDSSSDTSLDGFNWGDAPPGHFWADPFGFEHEGKNWLFFEDYSYSEKRAGIVCAEILNDGSLGVSIPCLNDPGCHYSYPYVFHNGAEIFMIPESYDSGVVDLYRCEAFPNKWMRVSTLLNGKFVDTSVWQDQGLWWIMTTSADPNPRTACLFLFYAESLTGEWHFHPANPISTDVRNNRGAGRIFKEGDHWIRPSQSCSPTYGYSFTLNKITELSTQQYREQALRTVTPEFWKGLCGVHTYNRIGNLEFIDGARMVPKRQVETMVARG